MTEQSRQLLTQQGGGQIVHTAEVVLSQMEMTIVRRLDTSGYRIQIGTGFEHLLVTGNTLLFMGEDYRVKVFRLDQYIVRRAPDGQVLMLMTKEMIDPKSMDGVELAATNTDAHSLEAAAPNLRMLPLYTSVERDDNGDWNIRQAVNDNEINRTKFTVSPWIPVRYKAVAGENYGRGLAEEIIGDLRSFDGLSKAILDGSVAAARLLMMVNPTGVTKLDDLDKENGEIVYGRAEDVTFLQSQKGGDLSIASATQQGIEARLGKAFLLETEVQPRGERVTAEQIRRIAIELEGNLGGIFSMLAVELQAPLLERVVFQMQNEGVLPQFQEEEVSVTILTGLEALSREIELEKLLGAVQIMGQFGEAGLQRVNVGAIIERVLANIGLDTAGIVKTEEEVQAEQQAAQQQQMQQLIAQQATQTAGRVIEQSAQPQQEAGAPPVAPPQLQLTG